mgnify:CR=1 FL=1
MTSSRRYPLFGPLVALALTIAWLPMAGTNAAPSLQATPVAEGGDQLTPVLQSVSTPPRITSAFR